jgi:hypothetical protein
MKDDKNQIIRSMKSYEAGGASDNSCIEEYTDTSGKKKKRRKKGCGSVTKFRTSSGSNNGGGALGAILGIGSAIGAGLGLKKMLGKQKKGGSVKRKMQSGGTANRMASSARSGADNMNTNTTQVQKLNMPSRTSGMDNMNTNTTQAQKLDYKKGGASKRKMQVGGIAKRPNLSARVKPVVKAVKSVKATVKRRG